MFLVVLAVGLMVVCASILVLGLQNYSGTQLKVRVACELGPRCSLGRACSPCL